MSELDDRLPVVIVADSSDEFESLSRRHVNSRSSATAAVSAITARFYGFTNDDRPLVIGVPPKLDEPIAARTTIKLSPSQIGLPVVLLFEDADYAKPIIVGILHERNADLETSASDPEVSVQADDERLVLSAQREIVLRCGNASLTLTRAGKVLIRGSYILSRSTGYNKIKGAAVDIN